MHTPKMPASLHSTPAQRGMLRILATAGLACSVTACSLPRMIDSEVESYVGTPAAIADTTYRFERLPSQQSQPQAQERIEALAQTALQRVGLTRTDNQPHYRVQVHTSVVQFQPVAQRVVYPISPYVPTDGTQLASPMLRLFLPTWYGHSVSLVMRDAASSQVAYETNARFDGPWSDSTALWPAILEAALQDYPHPPAGVRKVTIELPPGAMPTPR